MRALETLESKSFLEIMNNSIETGFKDYDKYIFDLKPEEITILFGRNGEGKSTVASQILAHHINNKGRAYLFSGELGPNKIQDWLYRQVVGTESGLYRTIDTKYGPVKELKPYVVKALKKWHEARLFIYYNDQKDIDKKTNMLFDDMENAAAVGVSLYVIDNLMVAITADANSQYADQSNLVQRCKDFAVRTHTHVILIAHPHKGSDELTEMSKQGNLTKTDISGTNDIPNKADNIIAVERLWKDNNTGEYNPRPDMYLTSLKDRYVGQRRTFEYFFSKESLRFYNGSTPENINYNWRDKVKGAMEQWEKTEDSPF